MKNMPVLVLNMTYTSLAVYNCVMLYLSIYSFYSFASLFIVFIVLHLHIVKRKRGISSPILLLHSQQAISWDSAVLDFCPMYHVGSYRESTVTKTKVNAKNLKLLTFITQDERVISPGLFATPIYTSSLMLRIRAQQE